MTSKARTGLLALQSKIAYCINRAADASGNDSSLTALIDVIERQEKEHRAYGRRLVGSKASVGRASVRAAANHFICKVVYEGLTKYQAGQSPISSLHGVRRDFVMGAILCADRRFTDRLFAEVREAFPDESPDEPIARAAAVDYCGAIIGAES